MNLKTKHELVDEISSGMVRGSKLELYNLLIRGDYACPACGSTVGLFDNYLRCSKCGWRHYEDNWRLDVDFIKLHLDKVVPKECRHKWFRVCGKKICKKCGAWSG